MASIRPLTRELSYQPLPFCRDYSTESILKLDLNSLCIRRPTETFFVQVKNQNLIAWGIEYDDLLIIEKTDHFAVNDLLVIEKNREFKFYQFFNEIENTQGKTEKILFSLDVTEPNLRLNDWHEVKIAGIITNVVHPLHNRSPRPLPKVA